jgi:hypothetical protein
VQAGAISWCINRLSYLRWNDWLIDWFTNCFIVPHHVPSLSLTAIFRTIINVLHYSIYACTYLWCLLFLVLDDPPPHGGRGGLHRDLQAVSTARRRRQMQDPIRENAHGTWVVSAWILSYLGHKNDRFSGLGSGLSSRLTRLSSWLGSARRYFFVSPPSSQPALIIMFNLFNFIIIVFFSFYFIFY